MQSADYKTFIVFYRARETDGSYYKRFKTFKTWKSALEFACELISDLDVLDPAGPRYRVERIEAHVKLKYVACVRDLEWTHNDDGIYTKRITHRWYSKSAADWQAYWGGITNELMAVLEPERYAAMQERRRK